MTFKHLLARVAVGAGIGVAAAVMGAGLANADPASAHLQQAHSVAGGNQVHQAQPNISRVQPISRGSRLFLVRAASGNASCVTPGHHRGSGERPPHWSAPSASGAGASRIDPNRRAIRGCCDSPRVGGGVGSAAATPSAQPTRPR
jgi:hypothetical protein